MSHAQTSDMFHGAQGKILSIFGAFIVQRSSQASSRKLAVVLVSDVIEKSAAFAKRVRPESPQLRGERGQLGLLASLLRQR